MAKRKLMKMMSNDQVTYIVAAVTVVIAAQDYMIFAVVGSVDAASHVFLLEVVLQ